MVLLHTYRGRQLYPGGGRTGGGCTVTAGHMRDPSCNIPVIWLCKLFVLSIVWIQGEESTIRAQSYGLLFMAEKLS
jgi:hypothetical protein